MKLISFIKKYKYFIAAIVLFFVALTVGLVLLKKKDEGFEVEYDLRKNYIHKQLVDKTFKDIKIGGVILAKQRYPEGTSLGRVEREAKINCELTMDCRGFYIGKDDLGYFTVLLKYVSDANITEKSDGKHYIYIKKDIFADKFIKWNGYIPNELKNKSYKEINIDGNIVFKKRYGPSAKFLSVIDDAKTSCYAFPRCKGFYIGHDNLRWFFVLLKKIDKVTSLGSGTKT